MKKILFLVILVLLFVSSSSIIVSSCNTGDEYTPLQKVSVAMDDDGNLYAAYSSDSGNTRMTKFNDNLDSLWDKLLFRRRVMFRL